jgi:hypothetical protein
VISSTVKDDGRLLLSQPDHSFRADHGAGLTAKNRQQQNALISEVYYCTAVEN